MRLGAVHKKDHVTCFNDWLIDKIHVAIACFHAKWHGKVGFVTGRHAGESAHAFFAVVQLPCDRDTAHIGDAVLVVIGHMRSMRFTIAVHGVACSAFVAHDEHGAVIEAKSFAAHDVEARNHGRMGQHVVKGVTVGFGKF